MASPSATRVHDFATPASPQTSSPQTSPQSPAHPHPHPHPHPRFGGDLRIETESHAHARSRGRSIGSMTATGAQVDGNSLLSPSRASIDTLRRRPTRSNTVRHYHSPTRLKWEEPGAEPGIDTKKENESHYSLKQHCEITVVDFSDERVEYHTLDNDDLEEFLKQPKEAWVQCRWINVNGLSWDVIRALGNHKGLHRLAIEDLMNTRGRTKVDWYSDQAFCKSMPFFCFSCPPPQFAVCGQGFRRQLRWNKRCMFLALVWRDFVASFCDVHVRLLSVLASRGSSASIM